jgi:hypothetical protein
MFIRIIPLTNVLSPVVPLMRLSNLLKTIMVRLLRATHLRVAQIMERFAKRHPQRASPGKMRIRSSLATITTMALNMTLFHHPLHPHLVVNLEYAGSVCRIMGQSRVPMEFVVSRGLQRAVRRNHPSRTDIRAPHHSMPPYLRVPGRPSLMVDQIEHQR